jgi:hypothetical protein
MVGAMLLAQRRKTPIPIVRRRACNGQGARFQPEWQPVFCPDVPEREATRRHDPTRSGRSWLIQRRYRSFAETTALTLASTAIVSFGVTVKNVGLTFDTGLLWLAAWPVSAIIAIPLRLVLTPLVNRCIRPLIEPASPHR